MLQVLVGHGSGEGASVTVRRDGDEVKVAVALGPDSSPTAETERAWLHRVITRLGGRHELEGGSESLIFPADGANERRETAALRKKLDEARKQGEVYARELAAIFERGEEATAASTVPPVPGVPLEARLLATTKICAGVASELKNALGPASRELATLRRHDVTDEHLDTLRRRLAHTLEIVTSLASVGEIRMELDTEVDLAEVARGVVKALSAAMERAEVTLKLQTVPAEGRVYVRRGAKAMAVLVRELLGHAVEASPRGATVEVTLRAAEPDGLGARIIIDDAGSPLPASGRRGFLALETHAGAYGRPSGVPIFLAAELAACQRATLELADAPSGGLRVTVTLAKPPRAVR
jgi:hypothetical protein